MSSLLVECPGCGFVKVVENGDLPAAVDLVRCVRCAREFSLQPVATEVMPGGVMRANTSEQWGDWQNLAQQQTPVEEPATRRRRLRLRLPGRWFAAGCAVAGLTVGLAATAIWFDVFLQQPLLPQPLRAQLLVTMKEAGLLRPGGAILLSKQTFRPGEPMQVRVAFTDDIERRANLCCAPEQGECLLLQEVSPASTGFTSLQIEAPRKSGRYELRLFPWEQTEMPITRLEFEVR